MIAYIRRYWHVYIWALIYVGGVTGGGVILHDPNRLMALLVYYAIFLLLPAALIVIDEAAIREAGRKARDVILKIEQQTTADRGVLFRDITQHTHPHGITIHMPTPRPPSPGEIDEAYEMVQTWAENLAGAEEEQQ